MFDFTKNNSDKNFVVDEALDIKYRYKIDNYSNNTNFNYLKSIIKKIVNCRFITEFNRQKINLYFKSFLI